MSKHCRAISVCRPISASSDFENFLARFMDSLSQYPAFLRPVILSIMLPFLLLGKGLPMK